MSLNVEACEGAVTRNERQAFLSPFSSPGTFSSETIGYPEGSGVVLPVGEIVQMFADGRLRGNVFTFYHGEKLTYGKDPNNNERDLQLFELKPLSEFHNFMNDDLDPLEKKFLIKLRETDPNIPPYAEAFNRAAVEGAFLVDGGKDVFARAQFQMAYMLAEHNTYFPLWDAKDSEIVESVDSFISRHKLHEVLNFPDQASDDYLKTMISLQALLISRMITGKHTLMQSIMSIYTESVTNLAAYIYATLKSGIETGYDKYIFTDEELKPFLISLAKAECSPKKLEQFNPVFKSSYSNYVNAAFDMGLYRIAPHAFSLGNRATLEALEMEGENYLTRMRSTSSRVMLNSLEIDALNDALVDDPIEEKNYTFVSKSIYSVLGEALQKNRGLLDALIEKYGLPKIPTDQTQYGIDFDAISRFDLLLWNWIHGENDQELDIFVEKVYANMKKTSDLIRGAVYVEDGQLNRIAAESISRSDIGIELVNSYYNNASNLTIADVKNQSECLKNGVDPEDLLETMRDFYDSHREEYPFSALFLYGRANVDLSVYQTSKYDPRSIEVCVVPKSYLRQAFDARIKYRAENSGHAVS